MRQEAKGIGLKGSIHDSRFTIHAFPAIAATAPMDQERS